MSTNWKSANWNSLISGERCPVCEQIRLDQKDDDYLLYICDLPFSRLYLAKNQFVKGYCVLICHRHVIELHELSKQERASYFDDVALVAKALQSVFQADKMNYNILGNMIPHLHTHILPRYFTDSAPHRPIDPGTEKVLLTTTEYEDRIQLILDQVQLTQE
jgi:diadenosine tetraphosphate (Ap4A) HIT family hydrolase